jgi:hypothetical protein
MGLADLTHEDYEPFRLYLESLKGDPTRIAILAAHNFVEEMIEKAIGISVSNSEWFDVPGMRFVDKLKIFRRMRGGGTDDFCDMLTKLNDLRAAAAHRDYEALREQKLRDFRNAAEKIHQSFAIDDPELLLQHISALCFGYLASYIRRSQNNQQSETKFL